MICKNCAKFPFCKSIEDNKKECKEYIKIQRKLKEKKGLMYIFEKI